jgi:hypothetical protein
MEAKILSWALVVLLSRLLEEWHERVGEDVGDFESDEMGGGGGGGGISPLRRSADSSIALMASSPAATFLETVCISARIFKISWLLPREVGSWRQLKSWAKCELVVFRDMMMMSCLGIWLCGDWMFVFKYPPEGLSPPEVYDDRVTLREGLSLSQGKIVASRSHQSHKTVPQGLQCHGQRRTANCRVYLGSFSYSLLGRICKRTFALVIWLQTQVSDRQRLCTRR